MATKYRLKVRDADQEIEVEPDEHGNFVVTVDGRSVSVSLAQIDDSARYSLIVDNKPYDIFAEETPVGFHVRVGGHTISAVYGGDDNFRSSTSAALSETVAQAQVVVQLSATPTSASQGTPITFSVAVTPANGGSDFRLAG